jgi:putative YjhG/YagF family dehydratase
MSTTQALFDPLLPNLFEVKTRAPGPAGALPLTDNMLRSRPSGDLFGLTQNAGMGWNPAELDRPQFLILSTQGGLREPDGRPVALGYHTGHWEIGLLVDAAAREITRLGSIPFAGYVSDPCDGRTQGTPGMFDSLPYRNDAALVFRRLIRSLPTRAGVLGVATCDKGLPAMMMALAGLPNLPAVLVPGGVTLPPERGEDAGKVQTLGTRYAHGLVSLEEASELGCRACASPGGGCQFLGTAATAQVIAEALGLALPHSALAPSGQPVWTEVAIRSARAMVGLRENGLTTANVLTSASIRNALAIHAAFGGSTNLLLHIPAIAHAAGLPRPTVDNWLEINRLVPRLVDVLPNGPTHHPTVRVFLAGGVPEVMLHLRDLGVLETDALTVTGQTLDRVLDAWASSDRRRRFRQCLETLDGVDPDTVILSPERARAAGLTPTVAFPRGNIAPEGAVIKSTALDPSVVGVDGVFRHEGPIKLFTSEKAVMAALKTGGIGAGDIVVLAGIGPLGTGMEETAQITIALKHLPFGHRVTLITDGRFSGVSTGACIGHVGPEALAGGPIGRLRSGDYLRIAVDCNQLDGQIEFVGEPNQPCSPEDGARILASRPPHPDLAPDPALPADTRLWAALQQVGGGTWGGCVYDPDAIVSRLQAHFITVQETERGRLVPVQRE